MQICVHTCNIFLLLKSTTKYINISHGWKTFEVTKNYFLRFCGPSCMTGHIKRGTFCLQKGIIWNFLWRWGADIWTLNLPKLGYCLLATCVSNFFSLSMKYQNNWHESYKQESKLPCRWLHSHRPQHTWALGVFCPTPKPISPSTPGSSNPLFYYHPLVTYTCKFPLVKSYYFTQELSYT